MQKSWTSFLAICLVVCLAICPLSTVSAEDSGASFSAQILTNIINTEQRTVANDIRLTNATSEDKSVTVYNAMYDASGVLIGAGSQNMQLKAGTDEVVSVALSYTMRTEGCVQKIFLWDAQKRPLMKPLVQENIVFETTPAKITLSQSQATIWVNQYGEQSNWVELTAAIEPSNAVLQRLTWESSDPQVAKVDAYGNILAFAPGEAVLTATSVSSGVSESCTVTVKLEPDSISFAQTEWELNYYESEIVLDPALSILPHEAEISGLIWNSSNPEVAEVVDGMIHGKAEGEAVISVYLAHNPDLRAECLVRIKRSAVGLNLNQTAVNMWDTGTYQLVATVTPADYFPAIYFTSSDSSVAEVDSTGRITAHKKGTTLITASTGTLQATCQVTVYRETDHIGQASAKYESNGNPATISSGSGDSGGKSYGAYQFASNYKTPYQFAQWLISSGENSDWGNRLSQAYSADGNSFGSNFDTTWKTIAGENSEGFLLAQHAFIKTQYYDVTVKKLLSDLGFDVAPYGLALKSAIWSRSVQHGSGGAFKVIKTAFEEIGGYADKSEEDLIRAIYTESGLALEPEDSSKTVITSESAKQYVDENGDYLVYGKYLKYYSKNSASVQYGVWKRLNINELADLLNLLQNPPVVITK